MISMQIGTKTHKKVNQQTDIQLIGAIFSIMPENEPTIKICFKNN